MGVDTNSSHTLARRRCQNHAAREAAARCKGCGRFYCRECVSIFDHRLLCASCIANAAKPDGPARANPLQVLRPVFHAAFACVILWASFYLLGRFLLTIPSEYLGSYLDGAAIQGEE